MISKYKFKISIMTLLLILQLALGGCYNHESMHIIGEDNPLPSNGSPSASSGTIQTSNLNPKLPKESDNSDLNIPKPGVEGAITTTEPVVIATQTMPEITKDDQPQASEAEPSQNTVQTPDIDYHSKPINKIKSYVNRRFKPELPKLVIPATSMNEEEDQGGDVELPSIKSVAGEHYVTFTFDDGPQYQNTPRLLDALAKRNLKATFFCVGACLNSPAGQEIAKREFDEGHLVANHSYNHPDLTGLDLEGLQDEISWTDNLIENATGNKARYLRPPYGSFNDVVQKTIRKPFILWSIDPRDWEAGQTSESIVQSVIDQLEANKGYMQGNIILLHDLHSRSVDAAIILFDLLPKYGYKIIGLEEMLGMINKPIKAGVPYYGVTYD